MRRLIRGSVLLVVAAGIWAFPLHASANSQTTCADPTNCKTVQIDGNGKLTSPSTSGTITLSGLSPSTTYNVVDAIEYLPGHTFATGTYTISWGTCTVVDGIVQGSAFGGTFVVGTGGSYPNSPPPTTLSPTGVTITSSATGTFSCAYTLVYPTGTPPAGTVSARNDFWVLTGTTVVTQVASNSVPPGGGEDVPEVPLAILIPAGMLLLGAGYVFLRRRRTPATAS